MLAFFLYRKFCTVLLSMLKLETSNGNVILLILTHCYFIDKKYQVLIKVIKYRYFLLPSLLKWKGNFFGPSRGKCCADCRGTPKELTRCSRWRNRQLKQISWGWVREYLVTEVTAWYLLCCLHAKSTCLWNAVFISLKSRVLSLNNLGQDFTISVVVFLVRFFFNDFKLTQVIIYSSAILTV